MSIPNISKNTGSWHWCRMDRSHQWYERTRGFRAHYRRFADGVSQERDILQVGPRYELGARGNRRQYDLVPSFASVTVLRTPPFDRLPTCDCRVDPGMPIDHLCRAPAPCRTGRLSCMHAVATAKPVHRP